MATRLYMRNAQFTAGVATSGAWDVDGNAYLLSTYKASDLTTTYSASGTTGQKVVLHRFVTLPLYAGQTINGALTCYALADASSGTTRARLEAYVVSLDGATVRASLLVPADYSSGSAFNGTMRNKAWSLMANAAFSANYLTKDGDRIVVVIGATDPSASFTLDASTGGGGGDTAENETGTAGSQPWVEFSANLYFYDPRITNCAAGIANPTTAAPAAGTGNTNALQVMWATQSGTQTQIANIPSLSGWTLKATYSSTAGLGTNAIRVSLFHYLGAPLAGGQTFTLSGGPAITYRWDEISSPNLSGSNGAGAVVQANATSGATNSTDPSTTLGAATGTSSLTITCCFHASTATVTNTTHPGQVILGLIGSIGGVAFKPTYDGTPSVHTTNAGPYLIMAAEILVNSPYVYSPPVIAIVSPAPGALGLTDDIVVDVTDVDGDLTYFTTQFEFATSGIVEIAWNGSDFGGGGAFFGPYSGLLGSTVAPITDGYRFTFTRVGGWVDTDVSITAIATDETGNVTTLTGDWTTGFTGTYACGLVDETGTNDPVIDIVSPLPVGSTLATNTTPIVFDLTDVDDATGGGIKRALPVVYFPSRNRYELAHSGDGFLGAFVGGSTRTAITNGWRYSLMYAGGWPDSVITLIPFVYDETGREVA
jgi:hypothetical protein